MCRETQCSAPQKGLRWMRSAFMEPMNERVVSGANSVAIHPTVILSFSGAPAPHECCSSKWPIALFSTHCPRAKNDICHQPTWALNREYSRCLHLRLSEDDSNKNYASPGIQSFSVKADIWFWLWKAWSELTRNHIFVIPPTWKLQIWCCTYHAHVPFLTAIISGSSTRYWVIVPRGTSSHKNSIPVNPRFTATNYIKSEFRCWVFPTCTVQYRSHSCGY